MSKVILNIAKSLDGYLARIDGNVDFLGNPDHPELQKNFTKFLEGIDVIIMGSSSYDKMIELGGNTFEDKFIYVLTSQPYVEEDNVEFIEKDVDELLELAKEKSKKDIWLFGGAKTIQQFAENNLIDEYLITIVPYLTGTGIPAFLFNNFETSLELVDSTIIDGIVTLHYTKK